MDTVFIKGLQVETVIGVYNWEKQIFQTISYDIEMATNIAQAAATDELSNTIDYASVSARVIAHSKQARVELLETLVEQVAQIILTEFGVTKVTITIYKPDAVKEASSVGITITRFAN